MRNGGGGGYSWIRLINWFLQTSLFASWCRATVDQLILHTNIFCLPPASVGMADT
jgi:hypothetical protein